MPVKTDAQRINTIKKILNILYNYKPKKTQQEMLKRHKGSQNNQKFAITGKEIHDAQNGFSCGHVAKAFAYENSLLPEDEQLDIKIMSSTRPDAFIDSMYTHTLPCVKMADGNYYAIDPQVKNSDLPMIKTPVIVGNKIKHILPSMAEYPEYTIMALVDWTDERLYDFNKFAKMSSYRSKETQKIISEIETILKYTANNKEQFYTFCDEMIKQKPDIAKRMHVVVIEQKDTKNHVIEPLCRIALELETADGQKQMCYFAPNGSYAELKKMDEDDKILWKLQLSKYVNLYNNIDKTEEYLLKNSKIKELSKKEPENIPDDNTILSVEEIRKDVSTLARILIRGYVGWPYHDMTTKIAVLDMLKNIYDKDQEMTIEKFKRNIGYIPRLIPDNHLRIAFSRPRFRQPFVGENYAVDPKVAFRQINDTAIVALKTLSNNNLSKDEWFLLRNLTKWAKAHLPTSNALIVDLRGNGGGNDGPTNEFAKYLCGGVTNYPAIQEWVRTNKTANDIAQKGKLRDIRKKT